MSRIEPGQSTQLGESHSLTLNEHFCTFKQTSVLYTSKAVKLVSLTSNSVRESLLKFASVSEVLSGRDFTHNDLVSKSFSYKAETGKKFFLVMVFVAMLQKDEEAFRLLITCGSKCSNTLLWP